MSSDSDERPRSPKGRYRINHVATLTGVPEATLRAWERRYQVPSPDRTPSGYRVYTALDVAAVRRMNELCKTGVAPNEAAQVVASELAQHGEGPPDAHAEAAPAFELVLLPDCTNLERPLQSSQLLAWMDKAALAAAARVSEAAVSVNRIENVHIATGHDVGRGIEVSARVETIEGVRVFVSAAVHTLHRETGARDTLARGRFVIDVQRSDTKE